MQISRPVLYLALQKLLFSPPLHNFVMSSALCDHTKPLILRTVRKISHGDNQCDKFI